MALLHADGDLVVDAPPSPRQKTVMRRLRARREGSIWRIDRHRALDVEDALLHARPQRTTAFEDAAYEVRYGGPIDHVQYCLAVKHGLEHPDVQLPQLRKPLYPYQEQAVRFLHAAGSGILADEPGLGKTLQGISYALLDPRPTLVVCPATAKQVWQREVDAATGHAAQVLQGRTPAPIDRSARFVIVNYDVLDAHEGSLAMHGFGTLVVDEAHRAKNIRARRTKAIVRLADTIDRRLLLSGTLMMNSAEDLWPPLRIVRPHAFPDLRAFLERYTTSRQVTQRIRGRRVRLTVREGSKHLPELHDRMKPYTVRRTLREVRDDLPEIRHTLLAVQMPPSLHREYQQRATRARQRLRGLTDPARILDEARGLLDLCLVAKAAHLREWVQERAALEGRKTLVFSTRLALLDAAQAAAGEGQWVRIDGSVPTETRQRLVDRFQQEASTHLFLGQTRACGEALTLDAADTVVIAEADWSPAANEQAIRRAMRIGTKHGIEVVWLIVGGTIDERRLEALRRKEGESAVVLDGVVEAIAEG